MIEPYREEEQVDEQQERWERAVLGEKLRGTPVEGDEGQMRQLLELPALERIAAVCIIAGGEADTVEEAVEAYRFGRDVLGDIDGL